MVVPVYYEQEVIGATLEGLERNLDRLSEILVVYDTEDDPTAAMVREGQARWPRARLVRNDYGRGVVGALKTGISRADGRYVVVFMADMSDEPDVIPRMVAKADEGYDMVCASRYMRGGAQIGAPRFKAFLSSMAGRSLHLLARLPVHDATNSFRLYSQDLVRSVNVESNGGFEVGLELTVKAYLQGRLLAEVPTTWQERTAGTSKFNLRKWLPSYMRWYFYLLLRAPLGLRLRPLSRRVLGPPA